MENLTQITGDLKIIRDITIRTIRPYFNIKTEKRIIDVPERIAHKRICERIIIHNVIF